MADRASQNCFRDTLLAVITHFTKLMVVTRVVSTTTHPDHRHHLVYHKDDIAEVNKVNITIQALLLPCQSQR